MTVSDGVATKRLTEYADCAGCASKIGAAELTEFMHDLPVETDPRVLVDFRTADDAGVYRWSDGSALVQTVDFFTPIVDDPYVFGQIAAANALSDVYAMGGVPRTALAIAALPKAGPSPEVVRDIFRGGSDMLRRASVALLGGHTVSDPEVKFGYAVTGEVHPDRVLTNAGAKAGDRLVLTKPLGTGIIVRARKYGSGSDAELDAAVTSMVQLNDRAAAVAAALPAGMIHACTDVTGFGLVGHATEVAAASGVTLVIETERIPALPGALRLAVEFLPCGGRSNRRFFTSLEAGPGVALERHLLCLDPQTSGGLLMAVSEEAHGHFLGRLSDAGVDAATIGRVETRRAGEASVRLE
jgi:selenide, water dikinase